MLRDRSALLERFALVPTLGLAMEPVRARPGNMPIPCRHAPVAHPHA